MNVYKVFSEFTQEFTILFTNVLIFSNHHCLNKTSIPKICPSYTTLHLPRQKLNESPSKQLSCV